MIQVHTVEPPPGGYYAFQSKVRWDDAILDWTPRAAEGSGLWSECDIPAQADNRPGDPSLLFACIPFPQLTTGNTFTGAILEFDFSCLVVDPGDVSPPGSDPMSPLTLVPMEGDQQQGSHYLDNIGNPQSPNLQNATVTCADVPPTPTPTEGAAGPTDTPTGDDGGEGDEGGEGVGPTALPETGIGDTGSTGGVSTGVWALIAALVATGGAGLGMFGWRYAKTR